MPQPTNGCGDILVKERFAFILDLKSGQFHPIMDNEQGAHVNVIYTFIPNVLYIVWRGLLFVTMGGQSRASNR